MTTLTATTQHPKLGTLHVTFRADEDGTVTSITLKRRNSVLTLAYREMTKRFDCYAVLPFDKDPFIDFANSAALNRLYQQALAVCPCCQQPMKVYVQKSPFSDRPDTMLADCHTKGCSLEYVPLTLGAHHALTPEQIAGYGRARSRQQAANVVTERSPSMEGMS